VRGVFGARRHEFVGLVPGMFGARG
jgi:hypothetical protein